MKTSPLLQSIIRPVLVALLLLSFAISSTGVGSISPVLLGLWFTQRGPSHTPTDAQLPFEEQKSLLEKDESKKNGHEPGASGLAKAIAFLSLSGLGSFHTSLIDIELDPSSTVPLYLYDRSLLL
jgi:hypothetical protein